MQVFLLIWLGVSPLPFPIIDLLIHFRVSFQPQPKISGASKMESTIRAYRTIQFLARWKLGRGKNIDIRLQIDCSEWSRSWSLWSAKCSTYKLFPSAYFLSAPNKEMLRNPIFSSSFFMSSIMRKKLKDHKKNKCSFEWVFKVPLWQIFTKKCSQ